MTQDRKLTRYTRLPGNDSAMADLVRPRIPAKYVADLKQWKAWTGTHWDTDPSGAYVRNLIELSLTTDFKINEEDEQQLKIQSTYLGAVKLGHVESRLRDKTATFSTAFDRNDDLLNFQNGTLNVKTRQLQDHEMVHNLTHMLPFEYSPHKRRGLWATWLEETLPDPRDRQAIQLIMGYGAFTKGNPERIIVWLVGGTSTGKSTFVETIGNVLGSRLAGAFDMRIFKNGRTGAATPDLAAVMRKRIIWASETSKDSKLHADMIKRLVGNDTTSFRANYGDTEAAKPDFLPFIATNQIPTIEGADSALRRRWVALEFNNKVSEAKARADLSERLATCGPEIIGWLLQGYQWYLTKPGALSRVVEHLRPHSDRSFAESSIYTQFLTAHTRVAPGVQVPNAEIADKFRLFAIENEVHPSMVEFGRQMEGLGWVGYRNMKERGRAGRRLV